MNIEIPETGEYTIGSGDTGIVRAGSPTVRVAWGGCCDTYDTSAPTVHVAKGGRCWTYGSSAPTVHVAKDGRCWTCDTSEPTIINEGTPP